MKKLILLLTLCMISTFSYSQNADDVGGLLRAKLVEFTAVEIPQSSDDLFIASFVGDRSITRLHTKRIIDNRIVNAYDDVVVIEPWTTKYDYEYPTETITLYVDNKEDDSIFAIGIAVVEVDKYHTAITMLISRVSRAETEQNK